MGASFGIGVFLDGRSRPAWVRPWSDHYRWQLELAVRAEALGAASVCLTEHHRFADSYLPQPLVLAAAIAARTSSVRMGTAVLEAPLRHAAHIAEEAAVTDLVAGGHLELGLGPGYAVHERALFGVEDVRPFAATDAALEEVRRLLDEDGVTPPPVQRPFPLWLG